MAELNTTSIEGSLTVSETASIGGDLTANGGKYMELLSSLQES